MSHENSRLRKHAKALLGLGIIGVIVLGATGSFVVVQMTHQPTIAAPQGAAAEPYRAAISRGLEYLDTHAETVQPFQWLWIDYLQRRFNLDPKFAAANRTIPAGSDEQEQSEYDIHKRVAFPNALIDKLPYDSAEPGRQMMMAATHCDHIPLPHNFEDLLKRNLKAGGYDLTHLPYSLMVMAENGCGLAERDNQALLNPAANAIAKLAANPKTIRDLRYEAVMMLMHMGRRELVKPAWLDQMLREQQADGGWKLSADESDSNDHATMLAVWALLEYTQPDAPAKVMIRRPDQPIPQLQVR